MDADAFIELTFILYVPCVLLYTLPNLVLMTTLQDMGSDKLGTLASTCS